MTNVASFSQNDLDRLDGFDLNRTTQDILQDLVIRAGGDPMVALQRLVERAIRLDDEYDATRLMLDEYRKKEGAAPLVLDGERRSEHLRARVAIVAAQEAEEANKDMSIDGYTKEDLDYLHDMGVEDFDESIPTRPRDSRAPERCPQIHAAK